MGRQRVTLARLAKLKLYGVVARGFRGTTVDFPHRAQPSKESGVAEVKIFIVT